MSKFCLSGKREEIERKIIDEWFSEKYKMDKNVQKVSREIFKKIKEQDKEFIRLLLEFNRSQGDVYGANHFIRKRAGEELKDE